MGHHHEPYSARSHPEFVVLDLGGDLGALVIHADPDLHGVEIEISPADDDAHRSHKEVLERSTVEGPAFTAVFDRIPVGEHTLWLDGEPMARGVRIEAGAVAELDWRSAPVAP
jgi:hypothetical protein